MAFSDARRLGRIKMRISPLTEPPISSLGFDPLLSMPSLDEYTHKVEKRKCPIKALLLDQSFNAGVGNWVAGVPLSSIAISLRLSPHAKDEILFHSGVHPERRCHTIAPEEVEKLYNNTLYVCQTAVDLEADSEKFPPHWLFEHRWVSPKLT